MSDKAEKKPDAAAAGDKGDAKGHGAKGGGLMTKTPVLLGAVMLIEAVVLFAGFKFLGGGPKPAAATEVAEGEHGDGHGDAHGDGHGGGGGGGGGAKKGDKKKSVEMAVVEFRGTNKVSGRTLLFDVSIFAVVGGEKAEAAKTAIADRAALIKDRVRTIIAQSDPEKLSGGSEPGLETLRRQVKYQLDEIIGEGMIDDVLVPRCMPFRADF